MKYLSILALFAAFPTQAETIVSPSEFEAMSTGNTLYFSQDGRRYGAEQFFAGRRSKWRYSDGECEDGEWFSQGDLICFNYEGGLETQCWHFLKTDNNGYAARAEGAPKDEILNLEAIDKKPLLCKGTGLSV
jgi:hypothetical protein